MNQAIGRVIRHRADYGAILFLDSRFSEQRNQLGVSKWIRPNFEADTGVGGAIQSLVKFFRGAKAKAAANKALVDGKKKELGLGLKLEYEQDESSVTEKQYGIDSAEKITKIAFVRKLSNPAASSDETSPDDGVLQGYVPPNRIIKQVQLNDAPDKSKRTVINAYATSQPKNLASLYKTKDGGSLERKYPQISNTGTKDLAGTIKSAWAGLDHSSSRGQPAKPQVETNQISDSSKPSAVKEQQKQVAQQFFKLAMETLSSEDFGSVRKMLVALKVAGDKKEIKTYLRTARDLIGLLLQYDDESDSSSPSQGATLVDLLHSLLPPTYRFEIEKVACKMRFKRSMFHNISSESLSSTDFELLQNSFPMLMMDHDKWKNSTKYNYSDQSRVSDLRAIVTLIVKNGMAINETLVQSMYRLLCNKTRNMARILTNEMRSKQKMELLKEKDRTRYGEEGINKSLFHKPEQNLGILKELAEKQKDEDVIQMKEALFRADAMKRDASEKMSKTMEESRKTNPYLIRKLTSQGSSTAAASSSSSNAAAVSRPSKRARSIMDMTKTPNKPTSISEMNSNKHTPNGLDPLEKYLQEAKAEIYRKATPKVVRINRRLQSNAPDGTMCNICNKNAKSVSDYDAILHYSKCCM